MTSSTPRLKIVVTGSAKGSAMSTKITAMLLAPCFLVPGAATASTVTTGSGASVNGAVLRVSDDSIKFLLQVHKDQPDVVKEGESDFLFKAQGHGVKVLTIPLESKVRIDGLAPSEFRPLFLYNGFYRTLESFQASRILVSSGGGFVRQIKSVIVFLALILVAVPVVLMIVVAPVGSQRLSFMGAIGITLMLSILGLGCAVLSRFLVGSGPAFVATPGFEVLLTIIFVGIFALIIANTTRLSFVQGIALAVSWGACLMFLGKITSRIVGVPMV